MEVLCLISLLLLMIFKEKKLIEILQDFNHIQIQLLILYPYRVVPQTVHIFKSDGLSY